MVKQKYKVIVVDNFHFMDEDESYSSGNYDSYEEAVAKCREIIDEFLESAQIPGENAEQLYSTFVMYGETPHIHGNDLGDFSATAYAKQKCVEITEGYEIKIEKLAFLIRPLPGETVTEFKHRLKKQIGSENTK